MSILQARNEKMIAAPVQKVWSIITDISLLPKINPGVMSASGRMDLEGATRTCEMNNNGRTGSMTEKLVELVPQKSTVWSIEHDTMGMKKMIHDSRFCFYLEAIDENQTKITNESYYTPANFLIKLMNSLMMKKKMGQIQDQILTNIKNIAESN